MIDKKKEEKRNTDPSITEPKRLDANKILTKAIHRKIFRWKTRMKTRFDLLSRYNNIEIKLRKELV